MSSENEPKEGKTRPIPNDGKGRPPGTPNKATSKVREAIALIADGMAEDFKGWLLLTATGDPERKLAPDPKGAADLYLKAIEYHIPKLARTESHLSVTEETHEQWLAKLG